MANIREWLNDEGFDWENGTIVYQPVYSGVRQPGRAEALRSYTVKQSKRQMRYYKDFDDYGGASCPRFVAYDTKPDLLPP